MTISMDAVVNLAMALAGASRAAYSVIDDPKRFWESFEAAALNADRQIINTLLGNENSRYFKSLLGFVATTDGASINKKFYAVKIDNAIGMRVDPDRLFLDKTTTLAGVLAACTGEYCIFENCIFFIGTTASVQVITFTPGAGLSAPDELIMAVAVGTLAQAAVVGEEGIACAAHFAGLFGQILGAIANDSKLPEVKQYDPTTG